ncbi:MAG: acetyl-CoA carboxylase biotin carboxyl carrier protein subunit, partial [Burkholderiaceae bacterium]|nr:acetyl-CoA carboxylase biotin carboxyl carrier protein subunit [Burkholderiaceae bacterium]
VTRGTPLVVLEAMKMEHTIVAPADGVVEAVPYAVGDQVPEGAELVRFQGSRGSVTPAPEGGARAWRGST